jgi:asparagine synthase (glutamine-hydrolysing)
MTDVMSHRGPNAAGIYESGTTALGHRRLSILDLSDAGRQPMSNADGSVHVVFNGEIYNYRELRDDLDHYAFSSETDTEVLLHLYQEEGVDALQKLRGMFAFGIWDERDEKLFLARDRLGQKPLYYSTDDSTFRFASTITSLLQDGSLDAVPNAEAIRDYLTYRYVPTPQTAFEGIRSLEPGSVLIADEDGVETRRYWSPSFDRESTASVPSLTDELLAHLDRSTKLRLRSDVPVGVFLSGGLDSSLITALVDRHTDQPVRTYSVGFLEEEYNELEFARTVADRFDTDHHEFTVEPDILDVLPDIVSTYEQPFGDPSAIPTYYISDIAASDLRVILNGDGGDENFAGYNHFYYDNLVAQYTRLPESVQQFATAVANRVPSAGPLSTLQRYVELGNKPPAERYATWMGNFDDEAVEQITAEGSPLPTERDSLWFFRDAFDRSDGRTVLDDALFTDLVAYLPEDLLVKVDRASMAHSLEVRSPFLDHELVEFTSRIPSKYKLRRGREKKWLLKKASRGLVPDSIIDRKKQGFSVPIEEWFRDELYDETAARLVDDPLPPGWFDSAALKRLLEEHRRGHSNNAKRLWDLLMLHEWWNQFSEYFPDDYTL